MVLQDVIIGTAVQEVVDRLEARPRYLVVLTPSATVVVAREAVGTKTGYGAESQTIDQPTPHCVARPDDRALARQSDLTVEQTVEEILRVRTKPESTDARVSLRRSTTWGGIVSLGR